MLFLGHITNTLRRRTTLQLNIEGLTLSKMNVLHYHATSEHLGLQEAHRTNTKKLVHSNVQLVGSSLSGKYGFGMFVHKRQRNTFLDQSPPTSEIKRLCLNINDYKIVDVYKLPLMRLRFLDLSVFPHSCLYAGAFNCRHVDWGYNNNNKGPDGKCLARWESMNDLAFLNNAKDAASFYSGR